MIRSLLTVLLILGGISGCAPAPETSHRAEANTTRSSPQAATLDDDAYVAYRNAHERSPEIPAMIITLARQHLEAGEYLLTRFYLNEYRRDYPSGKERAQIEYLAAEVRYRQYQTGHDEAVAEEAYQILRSVSRTFRRSLGPPKPAHSPPNSGKNKTNIMKSLRSIMKTKGSRRQRRFIGGRYGGEW